MFAVGMMRKFRVRLGDLWWYTLLLFAAQRLGDVINMFVGLWLVPKYVPQSELGAVLPLSQFVSFIGIPLAIVAIPFMKFLNVYAERGEMGKVKSLLRDVFWGTGALAFVTLVFAWAVMPFIFTRLRVAVGSLGFLVVAVSILGAVSGIFQNAVQGLKFFSVTVWFNVLGAPLRLVLMLCTMPFRALSGYFVGQSAGPIVTVVLSLVALRKKLGRTVVAKPYWREDRGAILRYTWPIALWTVATIFFVSVDQLVIRHRLSDFDSAGYYVISRFAEMAYYLGNAFVVFLFPLVAAGKRTGASRRILLQSVGGTLAGGALVSLALLFGGRVLLGLSPLWRPYQPFAVEMVVLAVYNTIGIVCNCFVTYEMAQGRFRFLAYSLPLFAVKAVVLYAVTGFSFFTGLVPQPWLDALAAFNPNRLGYVLAFFLAFSLVHLTLLCVDVLRHRPNDFH